MENGAGASQDRSLLTFVEVLVAVLACERPTTHVASTEPSQDRASGAKTHLHTADARRRGTQPQATAAQAGYVHDNASRLFHLVTSYFMERCDRVSCGRTPGAACVRSPTSRCPTFACFG
jgi:hypothetical protein